MAYNFEIKKLLQIPFGNLHLCGETSEDISEDMGFVNCFQQTELDACPLRFGHLYEVNDSDSDRFISENGSVQIKQTAGDREKCFSDGVIRFELTSFDKTEYVEIPGNKSSLREVCGAPICNIRDVYFGDLNRDPEGLEDIAIFTGGDDGVPEGIDQYYDHFSRMYFMFGTKPDYSQVFMYVQNFPGDLCEERIPEDDAISHADVLHDDASTTEAIERYSRSGGCGLSDL